MRKGVGAMEREVRERDIPRAPLDSASEEGERLSHDGEYEMRCFEVNRSS